MNNNLTKAQLSALPKRMVTFTRVDGLNNHCFEVEGDEYEYVNGQFFKKIQVLSAGDSFGQEALQRLQPQPVTIKTEGKTEFAYLSKEGYESSLLEIRRQHEQTMIAFLRAQPAFSHFTEQGALNIFQQMRQREYIRGQVVFQEGKQADYIYFVLKGQF